MRGKTIHHAIKAVRDKGANTDSQLYNKIEDMPGESIYALSKAMRWSNGKSYTAARRLERAGMIHIEKIVKNNREVLVVKPKAWQEDLTPEGVEESGNQAISERLKKS
jgi:hypothetical protein